MLLDEITCPDDLRGLSPQDLNRLCAEIREFLVAAVARTGGHLGPNLGVVELTVALHRTFHSPRDATAPSTRRAMPWCSTPGTRPTFTRC